MNSKQVVVIGAGVGGLVAAIYSRLRGNDVLVLERGEVGGKAAQVVQSGYTLDPGPSIIILIRIYEQVFADCSRRMQDYLQFERLDPFTRVIQEGSDQHLDLPADRGKCEALVDAISESDGSNFRELMSVLDHAAPHVEKSVFKHPYHQPWQLLDPQLISFAKAFDIRKTYKEIVDSKFQSPLLRAFFYGFPSYGGQTYHSKAPGALLIPYYMLQEGVYYPKGGVGAIPAAFEKLAREMGVEFRTENVIGLKEVKGRIAKVLTEAGEVEADVVISNVDRLTTRSWLGHQVDWKPSFSYFTVHWGIKRRLQGLKHHTLLIPKNFEQGFKELYEERVLPTDPIIYLNETTDTDPTVAPRGCTNLFAVVTSPANESPLNWAGRTPEYVERVRKSLRRFGIEFDADEVEFERVQTPPYFQEVHGNYKGSLYGPDEAHRLFGLFPLRCKDEQYKNLFYCGGSVQPGAGLPMVTLSGKFAADLASAV